MDEKKPRGPRISGETLYGMELVLKYKYSLRNAAQAAGVHFSTIAKALKNKAKKNLPISLK